MAEWKVGGVREKVKVPVWEGVGDKGGPVSLGRNGRGEREKHSSHGI